MWFRKKLVENGLQSANSDLFSIPKSVMLTRCAFLWSLLKQLQHMDWNGWMDGMDGLESNQGEDKE